MKSKTPKNIRCYDNGGKTADRYTVVYIDFPESSPGCFNSVGMDARPFHPQGFGQHCAAMPGSHLGRRIAFSKLPTDCQKLVMQDLTPTAELTADERLALRDARVAQRINKN